MRQNYYIKEFGTIKKSEDFDREPGFSVDENELFLPRNDFDSLLNFILDNQAIEGKEELPFIIYRRQKHQQIRVKNYVGIIETKNGTVIEILPKIYFPSDFNSISETKMIFLKMLRHLSDSPFKSLDSAHLSTQSDFPILELFIKNFISECEKLISKGLRGDYIFEENNLNYLKGKLNIVQNIRFNRTRREMFYCSYSDFSQNTAQHRIIKSTLLLLTRKSRIHDQVMSLLNLISRFEFIPESTNISSDLMICSFKNRLAIHYEKLIGWCQIFLEAKSFTNFKGRSLNSALLFPMEKIFENYITALFKKYVHGFVVKAQDKSYFLIERHIDSQKFQLIPDLFLNDGKAERIIIDTKWKIIDESNKKDNYLISSADMYQLFAYGMKYTEFQRPRLVILYPYNSNFKKELKPFEYYKGDLQLDVIPFNLINNSEVEVNKIMSYLAMTKSRTKDYPLNDTLTLAAEE